MDLECRLQHRLERGYGRLPSTFPPRSGSLGSVFYFSISSPVPCQILLKVLAPLLRIRADLVDALEDWPRSGKLRSIDDIGWVIDVGDRGVPCEVLLVTIIRLSLYNCKTKSVPPSTP